MSISLPPPSEAGRQPRVAVRGTHRLRVANFTAGAETPVSWPASAADAGAWALDYYDSAMGPLLGCTPPRVAAVTLAADRSDAVLDLDYGLVPGVAYILDSPADSNGDASPPVAFWATAVDIPARTAGADLVDIAAPLVRPDGKRGGDFKVGPSGDRVMASGVATLTKAIWHVLLRDASQMKLKEAAPADLDGLEERLRRSILALPHVKTASVTIVVSGGAHARVTLTAGTTFGPISTTKAIQ